LNRNFSIDRKENPMRHAFSTLLLLALSASALAASGIVSRPSELRSKPFSDAPVIATLAEQTEVTIVGSDGGWNEVKTKEGKSGWLRLLNLKVKSSSESSGLSLKGLDELGNVARTGSTASSATTGAKGISKEDLAAAVPNEAELKKLERQRVSAKDAQLYASQHKLKSREVELPAATTNR
jgi:uncharacterized protein YgiM (DUF1202 family)